MFDRATVKSTCGKLEAALATLADELGCQIKVGGATFARDGGNCTFKVELATTNPDGTAETKEVSAFRELATAYGLSPDDLGKTFVSGKQPYVVCGLKPKATRFPILAQRADGKVFKFPADSVKMALAAAAS